jgi:excinuclease ABC subunit C
MTSASPVILNKIKHVPSKPGCYIFRDAEGKPLYVGKATNLRSRVRSYWRPSSNVGIRISRMLAKARDVDWIVTESELEALILECNLIKEHRPPYNVRLRDDKSYPYIIITKEPFPRVLFTRNPKRDAGRCFGPFSSAFAVRDTLRLLHRTFRLIPCGKSFTGEPVQRPCLYYHLGRCMAPCAGLANQEEYAEEIRRVTLFLEGKSDELVSTLQAEMQSCAEKLEFEKAARLRDLIESIQTLMERQRVVNPEGGDQDVVALVKDERGAAVEMFYIRGGKLIGQRHFYLEGAGEASPSEAVQEFLKRYYNDATDIPEEILLPVEIEERKILQNWLRQRKGRMVTLAVPRGGERLRLVELAALNAEQALQEIHQQEQIEEARSAEALQTLQDLLALPQPPERIEGFDISNIQGTAPVASMVVFEGGKPVKSEYRRFKIRYHPESPDDSAMMRETLLRRLHNYVESTLQPQQAKTSQKDKKDKFGKLPDLIVVDGGRGQLNAALKAMEEVRIHVPVIGLAKKQELIYLPHQSEPLALPMDSPALTLLRCLRDEAHRFALSYHRKLRSKRLFGNVLEEIPGIGPRRRRFLLRAFGSIEGIRKASVDEIAAVPTMTRRLALAVKEALS